MLKRKYNAQALAIAMVVLVVASILGISIYSRISKDKNLTVEERTSAEALEVSDLIIDYISQTPVAELLPAIEEITGSSFNYTEGITLNESNQGITNLLAELGIENKVSSLGICTLDENSGNEYYLNIKNADINTYFEIRPGQVRSFPIKGMGLPSGCQAQVKLAVRGETETGFTITKIYGKTYDTNGYAAEFKDYETSDTQSYCFSSNGSTCNNTNFLDDNWIKYNDDESESLTLDLSATSGTYVLDELRIKAVGGTVGVAYSLPESCVEGLRLLEVQVAANCEGVFRGKSILIPEKKWSSPIFDYVLFNGEGTL